MSHHCDTPNTAKQIGSETMIPPIVSADWLDAHPEAKLVDVRWSLGGPPGIEAYRAGHIPGAVFVDLDTELAAPPSEDGGRHPLPEPQDFAASMSRVGIGDDSVVVAYDTAGGASAGRLVWMLRNLGVEAALLDGGLSAWPGVLTTKIPEPPPAAFTVRGWGSAQIATMDEAVVGPLVIDARAAERYTGTTEPTGVAAGHIPGARSAPLSENLDADGRFRDPKSLRERYEALGVTDATEVIVYCGSGVTACHDQLAMEYAGLGRARIFVGSWSAYAPSGRPIAVGPQPGERV